MRESIREEVEALIELPTQKLKKQRRIYWILHFLNTPNFTFIFTLASCTLPLLLFTFKISTWAMVLLFHYFVYWRIIRPIIDKKYETKNELEELEVIIAYIDQELVERNSSVNR
jgi:hypothetical protein